MESIRSNPIEGFRSNPMEAVRSNPTDSMNAQHFKREVEDIPEYETNKDQKSVKMEKPGNNFENDEKEPHSRDMNKSFGNKDLDTTAENDSKKMPESVEIGMKIDNDEKETLVRGKIESFDNENDSDQEKKLVEPVDINYDEMENENEMEYEYDDSYTNGAANINPWFVNSVEDFLYYNCPECNVKTQSRERFLKHARKHPMAKEAKHIFGKKKMKKEPYEEDFIDDDDTDEEYDEFDESLYYPTVEYGNESDSARYNIT